MKVAAGNLMIVVDVGNSGAKLGVVRCEEVDGPIRLARSDARAVREAAASSFDELDVVVAVSGSDPARVEQLVAELRELRPGPVIQLRPDARGLPPARVEYPERAGLDRRTQVLAAVRLAGSAAAVISCGTAITVDVGDFEGALIGGAILPGLGLGAAGAVERLLREADVERGPSRTRSLYGVIGAVPQSYGPTAESVWPYAIAVAA